MWTQHVHESGPSTSGGAWSPSAGATGQTANPGGQDPKPWYKKKRWIAAGVILLLIVIGSATGETTDDSESTASKPNPSSEPKKKAPDQEAPKQEEAAEEEAAFDMKVEAKQMLKEFEENEAAADGKYGGKTLQITGIVDKVDTEMLDDEEYVVNIGGGGFVFLTVNCDDQSSGDVSSLKKGQRITVIADFEDGGDLGVELEECEIQ